MTESKPFCISKWAVLSAWARVRDNKGAAGVDEVSIEAFEQKLKSNLYRIWNRMSSGSYVPPPVRRVMIGSHTGQMRGIVSVLRCTCGTR
jgi:RNA-directed DNA polymerase